MGVDKLNLVWIDLEMTGLDTLNDEVLEAAVIVTDPQINIIAESPSYSIFQSETVLEKMDDWNQKHHSASGLLDEVRQSTLNYQQVEEQLLAFLSQYVPAGTSPMCGNSICQDRRFLARVMPDLERFFHYRNLDVSTIKELARRWAPQHVVKNSKNCKHRALDDTRESIEELKQYREVLFSL